jgi:uncharacterized repeat protein (TIGR01451 family)
MGVVAALAIAATGTIIGARSAWAQEPGECVAELDTVTAFRLNGEEPDVCELTVTKTLTSGNPSTIGAAVTFKVTVENTGNVSVTHVVLTDSYDQTHLKYQSASLVPTDVDEAVGILMWDALLPSPDHGDADVWEPGESRTVTVTFAALAVDGAENCVIAIADVPRFQSDIFSEFVCADVRVVTGSSGSRSEPNTSAASPTTRPSAPTPVVSVAPATAVPPTPRPVGVTAPDTGAGPREAGETSTVLLVVAAAALALGAGAVGIVCRRT